MCVIGTFGEQGFRGVCSASSDGAALCSRLRESNELANLAAHAAESSIYRSFDFLLWMGLHAVGILNALACAMVIRKILAAIFMTRLPTGRQFVAFGRTNCFSNLEIALKLGICR